MFKNKALSKLKACVAFCLIILLVACRDGYTEDGWYKKYEVKVICGECYSDTLFQMGHTTAGLYTTWYVNSDSQEVTLPDDCIIIKMKELPKPDSN